MSATTTSTQQHHKMQIAHDLQETVQQILHDMQHHLHLEDMIGIIDIEQLMTKATKYIQLFITMSHLGSQPSHSQMSNNCICMTSVITLNDK